MLKGSQICIQLHNPFPEYSQNMQQLP